MAKHTNSSKKKGGTWLLNILIAVGVTTSVVCAYGFIRDIYLRGQAQSYYTAQTVSERVRLTAGSSPADGSVEQTPDANQELDESLEWATYVDFNALRELNPEHTAWIQIPGTVINYPVMQGDDNDYYLKHLPDGKQNKMGSIFLDYRNSPDFTDKNTLIYGHYMKSGDMFAALKKYHEQSFYDRHPTVSLFTPEKDYALELYAGYLLDSAKEVPPLKFKSEADFEQYLADIKKRSVFKSEVSVSTEDKLVTLVTCAYDFENARLIIVGKLTDWLATKLEPKRAE